MEEVHARIYCGNVEKHEIRTKPDPAANLQCKRGALSTVNRILSGQTENPSFRDVAAIVAAMDGSLDAITGLQKLESENGQLLDSNVMQLLLSMQNYYAKTLDATRQQYMRELENKDKQYRDILTDKNRWLRRMFFCLIGMLAVISFLLIVDFINPTIGVFHP